MDQDPKNSKNNSRSLSMMAIRAMSIRLFFVVLVSSIGSYWYNYKTLETKTFDELEKYIEQRVERESFYFNLAEANLAFLANDLKLAINKPLRDVDQLFNQKFQKLDNGSYQNRLFNEPMDTQTFIPVGVKVDQELKKKLVIFHDYIKRFGHDWNTLFINLWLFGKEGYALSFTPSIPHSLHFLPPNFSFLDFESVEIGLPKNNPNHVPRWTGIFYDQTLKEWIVSLNYPVTIDDRYEFSLGIDLKLSDLLQRAESTVIYGSYNILFDTEGRLIAHPEYTNAIKENNGKLFIRDIKNDSLNDILKSTDDKSSLVIHDEDNSLFLAAKKISGPNWWIVIAYPETNLKIFSRNTGIFVGVVGLLSLFIELLMLYIVIGRYVGKPIHRLIKAVNQLAQGKGQERIDIQSSTEISELANSFNDMAERVTERDRRLTEQAASLEQQVQERTKELDVQRANAYNASKLATLGEISGRIAHEINNPLSTISVGVEASLKHLNHSEKPDPRVINYLQKIKFTTERISKIVNGMRAFNRQTQDDQMKIESLKNILNNTFILCEVSLKKKEIELVIHEFEDVEIECREVEISQILLNLIQNSIDAMSGSTLKRIDVYVETMKNHCVCIVIEDTGPTIPADVAEKMMNPFFTTKDVGKGTGLGLFISSGLAKQNNGKLYLAQTTPKTRMVLELPIVPKES